MTTTVLVCALLGLPAGWFAGVLVDRAPDALPLLRPFPGLRPDPLHLGIVALTVGLWALAGWRFAEAPLGELAVVVVLCTSLVALSVIDVQVLRLPDRIVAPTFLVLLVLVVGTSLATREPERIRFAVIGGVAWGLLLGVGWLVGMGFGDVKAGAVMGMALGWMGGDATQALQLVLWALLLATVVACAYGLVAKAVQLVRHQRGRLWFAFGPFLAVGCVALLLWSPSLPPVPLG